MIYVTIAVESEIDLTDVPGEVVSVSSVHPYEDQRWDRRELGADERYVEEAAPIDPAVWDRGFLTCPSGLPGILRTYRENRGKSRDPDGWIPHIGTECPVHPLDVVEVVAFDMQEDGPANAWEKEWKSGITDYRHVTDPDGIPYVYDDGDLPEWAEYVATDEDGRVFCYDIPPCKGYKEWQERGDVHQILGDKYANTLAPWTESLRRVWRD